MPVNQAKYFSDGTGRDSYIVVDNGGLKKLPGSTNIDFRAASILKESNPAPLGRASLYEHQKKRIAAIQQRESCNRLSSPKNSEAYNRAYVRRHQNEFAPIPTQAYNYDSKIAYPQQRSPTNKMQTLMQPQW